MDYSELTETIARRRRLGKRCGAEISADLLREAGITEEPAPFIHFAGTNGKGSCVAMVDSILREAGFKIGKFTSPHLIDFCERIVVDGQPMSREDAVRIGEKVMSLSSAGEAVMFDIAFMMAVLYFKEKDCDFWLIETGLGGRHDATNALGTPIISVITSIGFDHEEQLGHTLAEIAKEKAGIIKEDSVCVTGPQRPEVMQILEKACDEKDVYLIEMEPIEEEDFELGLAGKYQRENAGIAMGVINVLADLGVRILPGDIDRGFKKAVWPGRMEKISSLDLIIDGAHNPSGARAFVDSIKEDYPGERFMVCFGCAADKAAGEMIDCLSEIASGFIFTKADSDRAMEPNKLLELGRQKGLECRVAATSGEALSLMMEEKSAKRIVCGSLYLIGEVEETGARTEKV